MHSVGNLKFMEVIVTALIIKQLKILADLYLQYLPHWCRIFSNLISVNGEHTCYKSLLILYNSLKSS